MQEFLIEARKFAYDEVERTGDPVKLNVDWETDNVGVWTDVGACVTVIVFADTPTPDTVIVAEREIFELFSVAVTATMPLLLPLNGDNVNQFALSDTVQETLLVMLKFWTPAK